jgi:hypothetical protein
MKSAHSLRSAIQRAGFAASLRPYEAASAHIQARFSNERLIYIQWGHPSSNQTNLATDDQKIYFAQAHILEKLKGLPLPEAIDDRLPLSRATIARLLQREMLISGIGDVVYSVDSKGYYAIIGMIQDRLQKRINSLVDAGTISLSDKLRLHLITHSHGVTIGFELLVSLIATHNAVENYFGFPVSYGGPTAGLSDRVECYLMRNDASQASRNLYNQWKGRVVLGSFISTAYQLPLLLQRRQVIVNQLADDKRIDVSEYIGLSDDPAYRWLLFHDPRDLLSFHTKMLFAETPNIVETVIENEIDRNLDIGKRFEQAHNNYFLHKEMLKMTEEQLLASSNHRID